MNQQNYLDAAKAKLCIASDYALAQTLEVNKQEVSKWRKGEIVMSPFACVKIAITLGIDPAQVIADVHAETEKNPKKRSFWQGFRSRAAMMLIAVCTLGSIFSAGAGNAWAASGGNAENASANWVTKLLRIIKSYVKRIVLHCENMVLDKMHVVWVSRV